MKVLFKSKYIKESNSIVKMLMPSLLGIILCITCLVGTTWSWFTDNVTASMQSIKAANYSITVDIKDGENLENSKYRLSQKTEEGYKVTVKAKGSASTGYFKLTGPDNFTPLYSKQLAPGEVLTFTFYPSATGEYSFESAWGTNSGEDTIKDSDIIGSPKQSEEKMDGAEEELEDAEITNDTVDSTPAHSPNEEENLDKDINEDSDEEINKDSDAELEEIISTVQPTDDTEETFPPLKSNEESADQPIIETPYMQLVMLNIQLSIYTKSLNIKKRSIINSF